MTSDTRSSLSKARTYAEMAEYWDTHDLAEVWDQTEPVDFEVDIQEEVTLYPLGERLAAGVAIAREPCRLPGSGSDSKPAFLPDPDGIWVELIELAD